MADFNLIPQSYQRRLERMRTIRLALAGAGAVFALFFAVYVALGYTIEKVQAEVAQLEQQQAISARERDSIAQLQAEHKEVEGRWHLLESLRSGMPAKDMMLTVQGTLSGNEVWFIDWHLRRAGIVTAKEPVANQPGYFIIVKREGNSEDWRSMTHMTIKGQAWDHSRLSEFAQRLLQQETIQDVRVQRTAQSYGGNKDRTIDFDLAVVFKTADSQT